MTLSDCEACRLDRVTLHRRRLWRPVLPDDLALVGVERPFAGGAEGLGVGVDLIAVSTRRQGVAIAAFAARGEVGRDQVSAAALASPLAGGPSSIKLVAYLPYCEKYCACEVWSVNHGPRGRHFTGIPARAGERPAGNAGDDQDDGDDDEKLGSEKPRWVFCLFMGIETKSRAEACKRFLNRDYQKFGIETSKVKRIAGDDCGSCPLRANHHMGVGNIARTRFREQNAHRLSVMPVQRNHHGPRALNQPPQSCLPGGIPNHLRQRGSRNNELAGIYHGHADEAENPAVISLERDQPARVEGDAVHAAFRGLAFFAPRLRGESIFLAQAHSLAVSGPPVSASA